MEALGEVDAVIDEHGEGLAVFDALGDRLVAEVLGKPCDCSDEMLVGRVGGQVPYEVDVDLQICEVEGLEVREAGEPGAEVVEGNPAADVREPGDESLSGFQVLREGGFCDLEDEVRGIRAGVAELVFDEGQQAGSVIESAERLASTF